MPAVAAAPDELTQTCVLLLLHEQAMGCDELSARLHRAGVLDDDRAWTDRVLQAFQARGIVQVAGLAGDAGAARYELTPAGRQRLGDSVDELRSTRALLDRFLARSGEWIVVRGGGAGPA